MPDICSNLHLGAGGLEAGTRIGYLAFESRYARRIAGELSAQAVQFDFTSQQLVGEAVIATRMSSANPQLSIGAQVPRLRLFDSVVYFCKVGCALDGICDCRE